MLQQNQLDQLNKDFALPNVKLLIVFAHGKESGPWGSKIRRLADVGKRYGAEVISPDYADLQSPDRRVDRLLALALPAHDQLILVGSSMGGYVSIIASGALHASGLFLMAPAIGLPGYDEQVPTTATRQICIVHGWNDDVVPVRKVFDFAKQHKAELHIFDADHALHSCLDRLEDLFIAFLNAQLERNTLSAGDARPAGENPQN